MDHGGEHIHTCIYVQRTCKYVQMYIYIYICYIHMWTDHLFQIAGSGGATSRVLLGSAGVRIRCRDRRSARGVAKALAPLNTRNLESQSLVLQRVAVSGLELGLLVLRLSCCCSLHKPVEAHQHGGLRTWLSELHVRSCCEIPRSDHPISDMPGLHNNPIGFTHNPYPDTGYTG